jgi:heme/copper-type cytochrome/quinol oxidase subunit 3
MLALFGGVMSYGIRKDTIRAVQTGIRYGMILFIVSEMMLFLELLLGFWKWF